MSDLASGPEEPLEERLDYILPVKQPGGDGEIVLARRVFTQPFQANGGWQWASDHSGLLVEIEL